MSDRRSTATAATTVSPGARLLTIESRLTRLANELSSRAAPAQLVGDEAEWQAARLAARRTMRAAWAAGQLHGRPAIEHLAAAATLALPAWAAAALIGDEVGALCAEATNGAIAEVARTNGDTARAYVTEAQALGLPAGSIVAVGLVLAARPDATLVRRRVAALRAIGERGRRATAAGRAHLTPAVERRIECSEVRTLLVITPLAPAVVPLVAEELGVDGLLTIEPSGRVDVAGTSGAVAARLAGIARGRIAARAAAATEMIGEQALSLA